MVLMNVNANAQLGHVGIVEYSKILIFEILNYTTYHYMHPMSINHRGSTNQFRKFSVTYKRDSTDTFAIRH